MIRVNNETYKIYDWKLPFIILSMTVLHPHKKTVGHKHPWCELYFISPFSFRLYKPNSFHQVENITNSDFRFFTVWRKGVGMKKVVIAIAGGFD